MLGRHGTHRFDVAIVVVLAVYGQLEAWGAPHAETAIAGPPVLNAVAFLIASMALLWRRRAPATVLLVEAANLAALSVLAGGSEALGLFVPLLVSVYSAARYAAIPWRTFPALAVVAGALLLHDLRDPQVDQAQDVVVFWLMLAAAWPVGAAIRRWSDRTELLAAQVAAREARARTEERARIARELHDVVSHSLGVMLVQAEAARRARRARRRPRRERLDASAAAGATRSATCDASSACCATTTQHVDAEPQPGTRRCPSWSSGQNGGPPGRAARRRRAAAAEPERGPRALPDRAGGADEHAQARRTRAASTCVRYDDDAVEVALADDGRGRPADSRGGHGLVGMRERAALYGGAVRRRHRAGGGFEVARAPAPPATRDPRRSGRRSGGGAGGLRGCPRHGGRHRGRRRGGGRLRRCAGATAEPDVVLMDVRMPRLDGLEATRRILAERAPAARDRAHHVRPRRVRLRRDEGRRERLPAQGPTPRPARRRRSGSRPPATPCSPPPSSGGCRALLRRAATADGLPGVDDRLTSRELEVLELVARGLSNAEIAVAVPQRGDRQDPPRARLRQAQRARPRPGRDTCLRDRTRPPRERVDQAAGTPQPATSHVGRAQARRSLPLPHASERLADHPRDDCSGRDPGARGHASGARVAPPFVEKGTIRRCSPRARWDGRRGL